ncbi:MAG: ABC transporter substrate-binding protein [Pirellulales bacterium]|nr:ABC transporter substrate-binding protein [Pirellulales bacterium]
MNCSHVEIHRSITPGGMLPWSWVSMLWVIVSLVGFSELVDFHAAYAAPFAQSQNTVQGNQNGDGQTGNQAGGSQDEQGPRTFPVEPGGSGKPGARDSDGKRIFEREPYDELHTRSRDDRGKVDITRIVPYRFPENKTPETMRRSDLIYIRLAADDKEYEVRWGDVVEIRPYHQLVLAEASALVDGKRFHEAYDYFNFLHKSNSDLILRERDEIAGLHEATNRYLFVEAQHLSAQGDRDTALSLLLDLYERDSGYPKLGDELGSIVDHRIQAKIDRREFPAAQRLLANLTERFPENATVVKWRSQLKQEAQTRFQSAQELSAQGDTHEARDVALDSVRIWPLPEAADFLAEIQKISPRVIVGVEVAAPQNPNPIAIDDWAARRTGRLLYRAPAEFVAPGPQGGEYEFPLGELQMQALENKMIYRVRPGMSWSQSGREITGYDLVEKLSSMTRVGDPNYVPGWRNLLATAQLGQVYNVEIRLALAHVAPYAYLTSPLLPWDQDPTEPPINNGPFMQLDGQDRDVRFRAVNGYFAAGDEQPREVVERWFSSWQEAAAALVDRHVAVLDRIAPWDVKRLSSLPYLRIEPYAVPTVHCLAPNRRRLLPGDRTFRRGLLMALNREVLLETLLQGNPSPGSRVISGPFPAARDLSDVLGYAYDDTIEPYPYDPQMGMILCTAAQKLISNRLEKQGRARLTDNPEIVLAHPPHDTARVICRTIKQQWERLGLQVKLTELAADSSSDDYDFRLLELQIFEPLVDVQRLLGSGGVTEAENAYVGLALQNLLKAEEWPSAGANLKGIHRLVHQDVTILPLWQLTEYFGYHGSLREVSHPTGEQPVTLYQYIESWQSPPAILPDHL